MSTTDPILVSQLRETLRHRIRPMRGRGSEERASSPLELLYDLTYVIAFAMAAELLAHHIVDGDAAPAVAAYVLAAFLVVGIIIVAASRGWRARSSSAGGLPVASSTDGACAGHAACKAVAAGARH